MSAGVGPQLRALLVVLAIFAVGAVGYQVLFGAGLAERFRVVSVAGDVRHEHADGASEAARAGSALLAGDRIVSGDGGQAVLGLGEGTRVAVDARSSVKVLGISDDGVRVELEDGRVTATVRPGSGVLAVRAGEQELTADDAEFTVARGDDGTVAASTARGTVRVAGAPDLEAGEELVAAPGGSPLRAPVSDTLLLQVAWPASGRTREEEVEVSGQTQPGASFTVEGGARPVSGRADTAGRFVARVPLSEGGNRLVVKARSVLGREAEVAHAEVVRDTRPPSVGVTLEF